MGHGIDDQIYDDPFESEEAKALDELKEVLLIVGAEEGEGLSPDKTRDAVARTLSHHVDLLKDDYKKKAAEFSLERDEFEGTARQLMTYYSIRIEELRELAHPATRHRQPIHPELIDGKGNPEWN